MGGAVRTLNGQGVGDPNVVYPAAEGSLTIAGPAAIVSSASLKVGSVRAGSATAGTLRSLAARGEVTVSDGGQLLSLHRAGQPSTNATGIILAGSKVIVEDTDSAWQSDSGTRIEGALTIRNGGQVLSAFAFIGSGEATGGSGFNGGLGAASVAGAGSNLTVSNALFIGSKANGALTVSDGGKVSANVVYLGHVQAPGVPAKPGTISVGAGAAQVAASAGTLDIVDDINIGPAGTINFNHTEDDYHFSEGVESIAYGQGLINQINGITLLDGDLDRYTGETHVKGGDVIR